MLNYFGESVQTTHITADLRALLPSCPSRAAAVGVPVRLLHDIHCYYTDLKEKNKMEAKENINIVLIASTSIREKEFQGLPVV
jgi:hypothetical protein